VSLCVKISKEIYFLLKQTFLWKLSPPELSSPSYLLGSMHVKDARAFVMQHHLLELIQQLDLFAAETDIREIQQQSDPTVMFLPVGRQLKDFYTEKQYQKMAGIIKKAFGIDLTHFQRFRPFFVASLIDEAILSKDMPYSLDESLWRYAAEQGKELTGVEAYAHQVAIMEKIPVEEQARQLLAVSRQVSTHRRHILKLTELYVKGDIRQLHRSAKQGLGELRRLLLWERNHRMAESIRWLIAEQACFIAIGAGHLWGKKGVLKLLKDRGVEVEALPWGDFQIAPK